MLANWDFTLWKYEQLCQAVANSRYVNITFEEYFTHPGSDAQHLIILRHDVDASLKHALDIARIEHKFSLKATYYFRINKRVYLPALIDEIASYNHKIGYHYETMDKCNGDVEAALALFRSELSVFRQRYPVKTACMHANPFSKYDNLGIWQKHKPSDFGLLGEPYLSLDYTKFAYLSDTGRTWEQNTWKKVKDKVNTQYHKALAPRNTDDLIEIIKNGELENICLLAHPERWPKNLADYSKRYLIDTTYNVGKLLLKWRRRLLV